MSDIVVKIQRNPENKIVKIYSGVPGVGVPPGGNTDDLLIKLSNTDYDTGWIPKDSVGVLDHGGLTGLSDDDHPHYLNVTRGDARYYTETEMDSFLGAKEDIANKSTDLLTPNNITYPTTLAVSDAIAAVVAGGANALATTVYNKSGSLIPKGSVVYINGAHGNLPTIALSQANSEMGSSKTYGLTKTDISDNSSGIVIHSGFLGNLDTFGIPEGVSLWLSPTIPGGYIITKPTAPNHAVFIGVCTRAHPTFGSIEVTIQNGYELEELHNVSITSPANGSIIVYEQSENLWKNHTYNKTEIFNLSTIDISNKFLTLAETPVLSDSVTLYPRGGIPQVNTIDFSVTGNLLTWNGLGLDGFLEVGDILVVRY